VPQTPAEARNGTSPDRAKRVGILALQGDFEAHAKLVRALGAQAREVRIPADLELEGVAGGPVHAVFIRAPWVAYYGPEVEVLGLVDGHPVAIRQGNLMAVSFHPELSGETRLHRLLLSTNGGV